MDYPYASLSRSNRTLAPPFSARWSSIEQWSQWLEVSKEHLTWSTLLHMRTGNSVREWCEGRPEKAKGAS